MSQQDESPVTGEPKIYRSSQRIVGVMGCGVVGALAIDYAVRGVLPIPGDIVLGAFALGLLWLCGRIAVSGIVTSATNITVHGIFHTHKIAWNDVRSFKSIPGLNATASVAVCTRDGRILKTSGFTVTRNGPAESTVLSELETLRQNYSTV